MTWRLPCHIPPSCDIWNEGCDALSIVTGLSLLAPVPAIHLADGQAVCARQGKVAFGSQAWEVFAELDHLAGEGTELRPVG